MTDDSAPASSPRARLALAVVVAGLVAALAGLAARSLGWRMNQDAPTLFHGAWLASAHGIVPYRDFFELNAPGAGAELTWDARAARLAALFTADDGSR